MTFPIPQSLKKYYEERAIFNAVNGLVEVLDGKSDQKLSREEAKNYNQALLMAAQVRADFGDLLFRVWDETFGKGKGETTGEEWRKEWFESQAYTIYKLWDKSCLGVSYYYDDEGNDPRSDTLGVMAPQDGDRHSICLYVERFDSDVDLATRPACVPSGLEGWKIITDDNDSWWFRNEPVDMVEFLKNPDPTLERFRREAIKMAEFLARAPGHC